MQTARLQLQNNARPNAFKMVVLMTDGVANLPGSTTNAKNLVIQEANAAATAGYPIVTISMGALADTALMGQIASITSGVYFDIPGGQTAAQYSQQLQAVWKQVCRQPATEDRAIADRNVGIADLQRGAGASHWRRHRVHMALISLYAQAIHCITCARTNRQRRFIAAERTLTQKLLTPKHRPIRWPCRPLHRSWCSQS